MGISPRRAKKLLEAYGETRVQAASEWQGDFPLPQAVEQFYLEVGPVNINILDTFYLPSLAELWEFQAGYRWHGLTGERVKNWPDDWLTVAGRNGDPFIFSRSSGVIGFAFHGSGEWKREAEVFPDMSTMAACFAQIAGVMNEESEEDFEARMEGGYYLPYYRELAATRLKEVLGEESKVEIVLNLLWDQ
ncbi:MAG: hypothetical protein FWC42_09700 [Proteobacteria bacterium]|nr:hypothetical protein [Pseudomonadota bacterium]